MDKGLDIENELINIDEKDFNKLDFFKIRIKRLESKKTAVGW